MSILGNIDGNYATINYTLLDKKLHNNEWITTRKNFDTTFRAHIFIAIYISFSEVNMQFSVMTKLAEKR